MLLINKQTHCKPYWHNVLVLSHGVWEGYNGRLSNIYPRAWVSCHMENRCQFTTFRQFRDGRPVRRAGLKPAGVGSRQVTPPVREEVNSVSCLMLDRTLYKPNIPLCLRFIELISYCFVFVIANTTGFEYAAFQWIVSKLYEFHCCDYLLKSYKGTGGKVAHNSWPSMMQ